MKKILLALLLITVATDTMAEWTRIGESDQDGGYTVYADMDSVLGAGNRVKLWILLDFKVEQRAAGTTFLSKTIRNEYDCRGRHTRVLAFKLFDWNMERGKLIRSYSQPQTWKPVQPESVDEMVWKIACEN